MTSDITNAAGAPFWRAQQSENDPAKFSFTAPPEACVGPPDRQFFMGGVAMAMAVDALERWSEKPLLWATVQFLKHGMLGDDIDISVQRESGGHSVVQASATIKRGGDKLQTLFAALGKRGNEDDHQFAQMPNVPKPEDCPIKAADAYAQSGNLIDQFERRTAFEDSEQGIEHMWIRPKCGLPISAPLLTITSDFFLGAHTRTRSGTSLDNTLRVNAVKQSDWILSATRLSSFVNGAVHGTQHQFAEDGTLLTVSSQTGMLPRKPG